MKKKILLIVIGLICLIAITVGVTYAFFSYVKEGTTENTVTTGTIEFLYTEVDKVGAGISIENAFPISDEEGKVLIGSNEVFDFKITSDTPTTASIPYEITARKKVVENMLDEDAVKLYLTKNNGTEEEVLLDNYDNLTQTSNVSEDKYIEKTLHTDKVPADSTNYEQAYRLRMWVDEDIDFSPVKGENGEDIYPYNDKTFTVTVNVYANAKVVTEEEIANVSKAEISSILIAGEELSKVEGQKFQYETSLPEGTTETTINVETISEYAEVKVEKLDSLAYSSNIMKLSTKKTLELSPGDNYFKITVISENKKVVNEYIINIKVAQKLSQAVFNENLTIYENPTLTTTSEDANENGLYKSTATNSGNPTYYFRGNVENYIDFAGQTWRIVRINEDGTIRLIMQDGINNNATYNFNSSATGYIKMYYSVSKVKTTLETWYQTNIVEKGYSSNVMMGDYFCEAAKAKYSSSYKSGSASMILYSNYTPTLKCEKDGNAKGIINSSVGLITYDEIVYAGGYYDKVNNYYLNNDYIYWSMSPSGVPNSEATVWTGGTVAHFNVGRAYSVRPVINLKEDVTVTGSGTSGDHWVVQ